MNSLVGYTGFVGSNIYAEGEFSGAYNSKNIEKAYGTEPDLLIYAGLRAEKYLANNNPEADMQLIYDAQANIRKIKPGKLVLISTIDVFKNPAGVDEKSPIDTQDLYAYGYNRYQLELWVREHYPDALIIRLPALFGKNIKKNFIYDYINIVPAMLKEDKYAEFSAGSELIKRSYVSLNNGFYKAQYPKECKNELKEVFKKAGFTALNFTDSRSTFQFYNLKNLYRDITTALKNNLTLWHPATEPVSAGELYKYLTGKTFKNELNAAPAFYDYRTLYADMFGAEGGYIKGKAEVMAEIKDFVKDMMT